MNKLFLLANAYLPLLSTLAVVLFLLIGANVLLRRRWQKTPDMQFRFQLIMLTLTLTGLLALILALPIGDSLRGQLLSLMGILLSASIAFSSTTFIGNILAGFMLKSAGKARPGDFITVADLTGRITEMDLLQTEIQTEFRDLVTVPNIYMVTQPLKVVRASGSIITAEVSLGYDLSQTKAGDVLRGAAQASGLKDCFVHIRELGDFSVTYRVAGLLEDIQSLISARSALLAAMLDALHAAGIEIVSPNFMNTRVLQDGETVMPPVTIAKRMSIGQVMAEDIAFDKADDAATAEKLRLKIEKIDAQLKTLDKSPGEHDGRDTNSLEKERDELLETLHDMVARIKVRERDEKDSD
ncbi:MAG: mechanosensitive ion channel domain-containing protein [Congregibacter sp.]